MSNSLDPDQGRHFFGPDLVPNCLQRLLADDTSMLRINNHNKSCMNEHHNLTGSMSTRL